MSILASGSRRLYRRHACMWALHTHTHHIHERSRVRGGCIDPAACWISIRPLTHPAVLHGCGLMSAPSPRGQQYPAHAYIYIYIYIHMPMQVRTHNDVDQSSMSIVS
eukprot:GHVU01068921.1.p3 GENE.GHVU01068921.1~~GHVU01068921.1.p3  ORF type:complete len:107 (-),score=2.63 GHVU01068921.1:5-325(-)